MTLILRILPLVAPLPCLLAVPACQHDDPIVGQWTLKTLDGHAPHDSVTGSLEIGDDLRGSFSRTLENDVDDPAYTTDFTVDADDAPNYVLKLEEYDGVTEMRCRLADDTLTCNSQIGWGAPVFTRE